VAANAIPFLWTTSVLGQTPSLPLDDPRIIEALSFVERLEPRTIEEQISICEVPAPPFREAARAEEYRRRFESIGLRRVRVDAEGNVIGERSGSPGGGTVVLSGHLDTVFPEGTDVTVRREGSILRGPGIMDDCRGLAVVLAVARTLESLDLPTRARIVFVGTVGEEGEGNLRGVRHLFDTELAGEVDYFLSVDAAGSTIVKDAVGSYRYTVTYRGPGGHSYSAFGMANPIHALGRAIAKVADFQVQAEPKVTFNVGVVSGGTSVNSIAAEASMQVDLRSVDPDALEALDRRFHTALAEALEEENGRWGSNTPLILEVDRWGVRPAGTQDESAAIVRAANGAAEAVGLPPRLTEGSTDANVPISLGIPALTMGSGGSGGGAHSLEEWFDTTDSWRGTQWVLLTVLSLAGVQ
jgi:tripeptide aminopeptidase